METIFRSLPPAGSSLGIAFSGGLDTRAAVAWLSAAGMRVHAYTANLAQPDEKNISEIPGIAKRHGASAARLIDCRESLVQEGLIAIQCGAFHLSTAGKKYFNTTPLGRAVTTTAIIRVMKEEGVDIFGDGSTYKGNDIQRFYRYGLLVNPELRIYKPWLDDKFVGQFGGRNEMAEYLTSRNLPYPVATEKAYSTDANLLGATHEAKDLEYLDRSMEVVTPIMGIPFWDQSIKVEPERVLIEFQKGLPVALNGKGFDADFELFRAANEIGGRHGLGMSDQIENRVIEAKSRGIYEAPGMALLHIAYERLLSAIHNENTLKLYFTLGYELGRLLYDGRWYDPEANLIKDSLIRWVASAVSGSVELQLRRGDDYSILNTKAECPAYDPEKLSMESKATDFQPGDRIGALEIMQMGISDNRRLLLHYVDKALADKSQSEIEAIKRILSL